MTPLFPNSRAARVAGGARRRMLAAAAAFATASLAAAGAPPPDMPAARASDLDLRAMLLLLGERRSYEPVTVLEALKGGPELRADLAEALGRAQDREGRPVLEGLLIDERPEVRRAAAFGLGLVGDPAARPALLKAVHDPDRETGVLAVEALGRVATPVLEVAEQLLSLPEGERWPRLLPHLFRFKEEALLPLAEHGLGLGDPELHRQAAYALARDPLPAAAPLLRRLLADPDPLVRAWAARGLGRVGGAADLPALLPLLADAAPGPVVESLRAAAALIGAAKPAAGAAGGGDGAVAWRARVLALLADRRAGVRVTAIEAAAAWLPDPGLGAALAAQAAAVVRASPAPPAAPTPKAVAGAASGGSAGRMAGGSAAGGAAPGSSAGRMAGGSASGVASGGSAVGGSASGVVAGGSAAGAVERGLALVALARGGDPRAAALAADAAGAAEPQLRARAAEAAGRLGDAALLARLAADPSALVREAALTARLPAAPRPPAGGAAGAVAGGGTAGGAGAASGGSGPPHFSESAEKAGGAVAAAALGDPDEGVRATACDWLSDHPVVAAAQLAGALVSALRDESIESPLGAIKALAARAEVEPRERGTVVELLERVGGQPSYPLRREAAAALVRLGRPAPPLGPVTGGRVGALADNLDTYREIVARTRRPRTVEVRTSRGSFRLRLDCPRAPRTCLNFLQLAAQHFYDGLLFHRVVPDFVIQAGDPRGDGFGGPGYTIRDEINRLRYGRGVAGMALAGPDTGGSQFFVTLSPQPHLDGGYTAFGEVIAGSEVLDDIQAGDRIEAIVEVP